MIPHRLLILLLAGAAFLPGPAARAVEPRIVFTDETVFLPASAGADTVSYQSRLIDRRGLSPWESHRASVKDGEFPVPAVPEGIHVIRLDSGEEHRFLAMAPPAALPLEKLEARAPRLAAKIRAGRKILAGCYGDSVTATGHYPEIFARLLERSLGGAVQVAALRHAHPGRSIDAALRSWDTDVAPEPPDLALIQYGLNDQAAGASLTGFLDQARALAERFRNDCGADVVFLTPTPDLDISPPASDETRLFRAASFGAGLRDLGGALSVPVADAFQTLWGPGGPSLAQTAAQLRPLYPPSYGRQMASLLETGTGDTLHPNALGHLAIARSILDALAAFPPAAWPLRAEASSRWQSGRASTRIVLRNDGPDAVSFHYAVHSLLSPRFVLEGNASLKPEETRDVLVEWPGTARDLAFPDGRPLVAVLTTIADGSRLQPLFAPFSPAADWVRERFNAVTDSVEIRLRNRPAFRRTLEIPADRAFGSLPLREKFLLDGQETWALGEAGFVRYAAARPGEAATDGVLDEWSGMPWHTLGDAVQARWVNGPEDHRATPEELTLAFALKAGREGIHVALRVTGDYRKDRFVLFFDPREPAFLGSPGPYFWVSGAFSGAAHLDAAAGETSPAGSRIPAAARTTSDGADAELFVPYSLFHATAWPPSGDLGFAFWWTHAGTSPTHLQWSGRGHPWNPRWFGVVRKTRAAPETLPFMVRIE